MWSFDPARGAKLVSMCVREEARSRKWSEVRTHTRCDVASWFVEQCGRRRRLLRGNAASILLNSASLWLRGKRQSHCWIADSGQSWRSLSARRQRRNGHDSETANLPSFSSSWRTCPPGKPACNRRGNCRLFVPLPKTATEFSDLRRYRNLVRTRMSHIEIFQTSQSGHGHH
eukprot:scaffold4562_cov255-Pinguiococcus_pyrenoidosus.AAC.8